VPRPDGERPEVPPPGPRRDGDLAYGLRLLKLRRYVSVFDALRLIRTGWNPITGRRIADPVTYLATVDHVVHLMDHTGPCPADEPKYVHKGTPPDPAVSADRCAGRGVRVLVVDTGFDKRAANLPWLHGVTGDKDAGIVGKKIGRYAGHGTFIAGVVRTIAPEAEVIVRAGLPAAIYSPKHPSQSPSGTAFESHLTTALERYILQDDPDIISLSAGTLTESAAGLMVFDAFFDSVLRRHKGVVIVAAAGNDGARSLLWPAANRRTVSVGALSANWRHRAQFSNFGAWVDVYAPGEYLTNAFPSGTYTYKEPPKIGGTQDFEGMAIWSGTSFSTPIVAGLIAARMSRTGENGPDAAAALIAKARRDAIFGVGAVLLPGEHRTDCERKHAEPRTCSCPDD
jgi:subtilisin family serine protease